MTQTMNTNTPGSENNEANTAIFEHLETNCRAYCRDIPSVFTTARGSVVTTEDGAKYLDFFAGAGALNYGHNHPDMTAAIIEHVHHNGILHGLDLHTSAKQEFLETIESGLLVPRGLDYKVQFTGPTGTDANEAALKLAQLTTKRRGIVAFRGSYHGMSVGALSVSGSNRLRAAGGQLLHEVSFVPYESGPDGDFDSIDYLERQFADPSGGAELPAAVIVEGVQIQAGVYAASAEWLRGLREWTQRNGALLIVDEVQTGCGRTGRFFSFEDSGVVPDIVTTAKSIGGSGLPLALIMFRRELDAWSPGDHTGTFRGNQLAFVTGRIALQLWQDQGFLDLVDDNSAALADSLARIAEDPAVVACRQHGLIAGIDFGADGTANAAEFQQAALRRGVIVERCGRYNEVVKLMPPINTPTSQLTEGLRRLESCHS